MKPLGRGTAFIVAVLALFAVFILVDAGRTWAKKRIRLKKEQPLNYDVSATNRRSDDEEDEDGFKRSKRFYSLRNVGCITGYSCCEIATCRPYCPLCNVPGGGDYSYGCRDINQNNVCDDQEVRCADVNDNGICDVKEVEMMMEMMEDDDEADMANAQSSKKEDDDDEADMANAQSSKKDDDDDEADMANAQSSKKKDDDDEADLANAQSSKKEDDEEEEAAAAAASSANATTTTPRPNRGQLEFTHHVYEEYMPSFPRESKPPIILQTIPQYSVSNFFSLSKHHHPLLHHQSVRPIPFPRRPEPRPIPLSAQLPLERPHPFPQSHPPSPTPPRHFNFNPGLPPKLPSASIPAGPNPTPDGSLFYGDIPIIFADSSKSEQSHQHQQPHSPIPPPTRHISNAYRSPSATPVPGGSFGVGSISPYAHHEPGDYGSSASGFLGFDAGNVPQPHTVILEQEERPRSPQQQPPPQPLLKYHLIRHSYPAKDDEEYFADIPAFMPGPPYLPKALPSKKAPMIVQRPPNRQGKSSALKQKSKKKKKKKSQSGLQLLMRTLVG